MSIEHLQTLLPDYAKDIRLNLSTVLTEEGAPDLTQKQIFGIALSSAYATKNASLVAAIQAHTSSVLSEADINAAKAAATIMAMNNIYYRFVHLIEDKEYGRMPAKLRMNVIGNPGVDKLDFELYSLAVSAINGCGMCMEAHVQQVVKAHATPLAVQSAIRIAAVIHAVAQALTIEGNHASLLEAAA